MSLDADMIVERRRLSRSRSVWRMLAFAAIAIAAVTIIVVAIGPGALFTARGAHIARVPIEGIITIDRKRLQLLEELGKSDSVKAVIISINSPGGTATGGEVLFDAIRRLAEKKPVVATVDTLAASAGYMIATATDRIYVRRNSLAGSVGVIYQFFNFVGLFDKFGVGVDVIKHPPLKAEPSPFTPSSEEARMAIRALVDDSYAWFVDLVADRRGIDAAAIRAQKGRVYTGNQAIDMKLADAIGGEREAIEWLVAEKGLDKRLKVRERKPRRSLEDMSLGAVALGWLVGPQTASLYRSRFGEAGDRLALDGLVSVWHANDGEN